MTDEMVLVPRAELLAWSKAWLNEYDPKDGTDCVTPFDAYLLKSPVNAQSTVHVEVLRHMKETIKAIMPSEVAALDAAIAALSAPPSAPVGAGEVDCRCVDCGGNQPGHDPTCSYMHELHGEAQPVGELIEDGAETEEGDLFIHQFVGPRKLPEGTKVYTAPPPAPNRRSEMDHIKTLQRMRNESWNGSPEATALDAAIQALLAEAELSEAARCAADAIAVLLPLLSSEQREVVCDAIAGADEARADILRALAAQQGVGTDE